MCKSFTAYWADGKKEILEGQDAEDALRRAGYGPMAKCVLDEMVEGEHEELVWVADCWLPALMAKFATATLRSARATEAA